MAERKFLSFFFGQSTEVRPVERRDLPLGELGLFLAQTQVSFIEGVFVISITGNT